MHKSLAAVIIASAASLTVPTAFAGQCPPDKMMADATKPDPSPAKGVTDNVLAAINLADEPAKIENRMLRLRKLTIAPGGVNPNRTQGGDRWATSSFGNHSLLTSQSDER